MQSAQKLHALRTRDIPTLPYARRESARGVPASEIFIMSALLISALALIFPTLPLPAVCVGPYNGNRALTTAMIDSGLNGGLEEFRRDVGRYPTTEEGLHVLVDRPSDFTAKASWRGPYVDPRDLVDGWHSPLEYRSPGMHNPQAYDLASPGPDAESDTTDDINNW